MRDPGISRGIPGSRISPSRPRHSFFRSELRFSRDLPLEIPAVLAYLMLHPLSSPAQLSKELGIPLRSLRRYLWWLRKLGLVQAKGRNGSCSLDCFQCSCPRRRYRARSVWAGSRARIPALVGIQPREFLANYLADVDLLSRYCRAQLGFCGGAAVIIVEPIYRPPKLIPIWAGSAGNSILSICGYQLITHRGVVIYFDPGAAQIALQIYRGCWEEYRRGIPP